MVRISKMKKHNFSIVLLVKIFAINILCSGLLFSNDYKISGKIEDKHSDEPLSNVNIVIKDTDFGTTSDQNGYFEIEVKGFKGTHKVLISHVGYINLEIKISDIKKKGVIQLVPTEIKFDKVQVEGKREVKYTQIINNDITVLHENEFSSGGYLDAADLIVTKNSVMVDENFNGKKTISIRGANANETLVLYDGIKINSNFNNIFDLSLLNTSSLSQVDIIRGGNLATFGGIGSAAVVNFIPKLEQNYLLRFYQRFGSYDSGDWGLNFYHDILGLQLFACKSEGASSLYYVENEDEKVERTSSNITINGLYDFDIGKTEHVLKANYIEAFRDYNNNAYEDSLEKNQTFMCFKYEGKLNGKGNLITAYTINNESEDHGYSCNFQNIDNKNHGFQIEYSLPIKSGNFYLGHRLDENKSELDEYFAALLKGNNSSIKRKTSEISSGFKINNEKKNPIFDLSSISINYNYKMIKDEGDTVYAINNKFKHNKSSFMLSSVFGGEIENLSFRSHINYCNDFRLPTPYQLLLSHYYQSETDNDELVQMESKSGLEIGLDLQGEESLGNWLISGTFFNNSYENKYREIQLSGSASTFLDNYKSAKISGLEGKMTFCFLRNKLTTGINYNKNIIDDKAAFPFKLESKLSANLLLNLKYFSVNTIWYKESERTGIIYYQDKGMKEVKIDDFSNIDLHVEANFDFWHSNLFCAFSARNLLGGELIKEGIAIRDKRFYVMLGMEVK